MKKLVSALICALTMFAAAAAVSADGDDIAVYVDNSAVEMTQKPVILDGRTLVPVRAIFEKAGATVSWDSQDTSATIKKGDTAVYIKLNEDFIYKNDAPIVLDVPAQLIEGSTYLPVRAVSEAMGFGVTWDSANKSILIATDGVPYRAYGAYTTGFKPISKYAEVYVERSFENLKMDLDGDGSKELITFKKVSGGVIHVNGVDYSGIVPPGNGDAVALAVVDINANDGKKELALIQDDGMKSATFYRFENGTLKKIITSDAAAGTIEYQTEILFDGVENVISDITGVCFTNPMFTTMMYSLDGDTLALYTSDMNKLLNLPLAYEYSDYVLYCIEYTDTYNKGTYYQTTSNERLASNTVEFRNLTLLDYYFDPANPNDAEFYIMTSEGRKAVIWLYQA